MGIGRARRAGGCSAMALVMALAACGDDAETIGSGGAGGAAPTSTSSTSATTSSASSASTMQGPSSSGGTGAEDGSGGSGGDGTGAGSTGTGTGGVGGDGAGGNGTGGNGTGGDGTGGDGSGGGRQVLPPGVFGLDGTDVEQADDDLEPFGAMVDGAAIVGLGEAIHTSGGFYAAKNRLIRYLVEQKGFRALAFESPRSWVEETSAYVEDGQGTVEDGLHGIFSLYVDEHTRALLEWLRAWNVGHADDPVRVYGFDVQQPEYDRPLLETFLDDAAPDVSDELLAPVDEHCLLVSEVVPIPLIERRKCLEALDDITAYVDANEDAIVAIRGADQLAIDRLSILGLRAWEDIIYYYDEDLAAGYQVRDDAMAQVFEVVRGADSDVATIVWAHDFHLRRRSDEATAFPVIHAFGSSLFDVHGDAYRPFAITSLRTGINWPGLGCDDDYQPPRPGSVEARLRDELGPADYLLDFALATTGDSPWIAPGSQSSFGGDGEEVLEDQYRGMVVLEESPGIESPYWACEP